MQRKLLLRNNLRSKVTDRAWFGHQVVSPSLTFSAAKAGSFLVAANLWRLSLFLNRLVKDPVLRRARSVATVSQVARIIAISIRHASKSRFIFDAIHTK